MNAPAAPATVSTRRNALLWGAVFAVTGFAAGFFGPMLLNPEANQGPLLGLLITGPGGLLLGVVLGAVVGSLPVPARTAQAILALLAVAGTLVILYFCLPPPRLLGYEIEAEIKRCGRPEAFYDDAAMRWKNKLARATGFAPRADWDAELRGKTQALDGVVLVVQVQRRRNLSQDEVPWSSARHLTPWRQYWQTQTLYAGSRHCADFPAGLVGSYFVPALPSSSKQWPPEQVLDFLGTQPLASLPDLD